ncbi:MAG: YraN family protein [Clostridia bacterium]|nr:YraN family protein [Clostridia bacterium]
MSEAYSSGIRGEKVALEFLTQKGFVHVTSRFRYGSGEIDLIAKDGETTVFIEVKARLEGEPGSGLISVTPKKQKRLRNTALWYAVQNGLTETSLRFDVIEITPHGIIHVENAF